MKYALNALAFMLLGLACGLHGQNLAGEKAIEIDAEAWINADTVSVGQLQGRTIVLYFWTSWSPVCKGIVPQLNALHDDLQSSDTVLVGLTSERNQDRLDTFVAENSITYAVGLGSQSEYKYNVAMIPYFVVIDPDGVIAWDGSEFGVLKDKVGAGNSGPVTVEPAAITDDPAELPVIEESTPAEETGGEDAVLEFIEQAAKDARQALKDDRKATEMLQEIRSRVQPYAEDRKISAKAVKVVAKFLTGARDIEVRTEAARVMGMFTNNPTALSMLLKMIPALKKKGLEYRDYQVAVIESVGKTGRFNPAAARGLFEVLERPYGADEHVKNAALTAYGEIRTYESCDQLVRGIAKLAPDPEDPWDTMGDDAKGARWRAVSDALYGSLHSLTGQGAGAGTDQRSGRIGFSRRWDAWGFSQWKKWIQDNKSFLVKKFKQEEEESGN